METQTLLKRTAPIVQVLQAVSDKIPVIAVMTASDEIGKLNFSTEIVFALSQLGKNALLINAIDTHVSSQAVADADILIVDCPSGLNPTNTAVANESNIVVMTLSAEHGTDAYAGSYELLKCLYKDGHYTKVFEIVVTHAQDVPAGDALYDELVSVVDGSYSLETHLLCLLCADGSSDIQREVFHQAAILLEGRLW